MERKKEWIIISNFISALKWKSPKAAESNQNKINVTTTTNFQSNPTIWNAPESIATELSLINLSYIWNTEDP